MMMAHDSGSRSHRELPADTIAAFQTALATYASPPHDIEPVRASIHALAAAARDHALPAEQVLVTLKDVWYTLPSVSAMRDAAEQTRLLQQVVTLCIKAYYDS